MSNDPPPQSSNQNQNDSDELSNIEFMKRQLEGAKKQLKEATTIHGKFDSMTELVGLQEGMTLEEARARAKEMRERSFGIAFEDGTVETTRKRDEKGSIGGAATSAESPGAVETAGAVEAAGAVETARATETSGAAETSEAVPYSGAALDLHPEALPWLISDGTCLFRDQEKPFEGFEDELLMLTSRADEFAWLRMMSFFPQLRAISPDLMRAFVRGNLCAYTRNMLIEDYLVSTGQHSRHDVPLGFAQITPAQVLDLEQRYPQLAAFFAGAGYIGAAHESLVLLDPTCAPIVVAAYVTSLTDELIDRMIAVSDATVAYAFHPDVYSHSDADNGTVYEVLEGIDVSLSKVKHWDQKLELHAANDEIIAASHQVKRISEQLAYLAQ
jgi:hypothetical protein